MNKTRVLMMQVLVKLIKWTNLATGSTQRSIRRNGHRVQVTAVIIVVLLQTAIRQVPNLESNVKFIK